MIQVTNLTRDSLVESAQDFSDRALCAYRDGDERVVLVNAAFAMEHLTKAVLVGMNPAFLMEIRNGQFDSLLFLAGYGAKARKLSEPKTIGAKEALARVEQIMGFKTPRAPLERLIEVRDGVVHMGAFSPAKTREALTTYLRLANEIFDEIEVSPSERWGKHAHLVSKLIEQSLTEVEHEVQRKITAAKSRLGQLMAQIPESEQVTVGDARQALVSHVVDPATVERALRNGLSLHTGFFSCPACRHTRATRVSVIEEEYGLPDDLGPMDHPQEHFAFVGWYLRAVELICGSCGLSLKGGDELRAANIPVRREATESLSRALEQADDDDSHITVISQEEPSDLII